MSLLALVVQQSRVVSYIRLYLPIYKDQVMVGFECGCWQGSRSPDFNYDCPDHQPEARCSTPAKTCSASTAA